VLVFPLAARAQPVSFQLKNDVAAGQSPSLVLTAVERVRGGLLALDRDDGRHFETRLGPLPVGKPTVVPIGDGSPGKAHYTGRLELYLEDNGPPAGPTPVTDGGVPAASAPSWSTDLAFDTLVRAPLSVNYDLAHLDLEGRLLRFQLSRPAGHAELVAIGEDGAVIGEGKASYHKEPPGAWLPLPWTQLAPGRVMILRLHAVAADGLATNLELIPWSVQIEHEDVRFDTDSALILPAEASKLDASYQRIAEVVRRSQRFIQVKLYVAGHTDTVGSPVHNRKLSLDRARAIAEAFKKRGLTIPIAYEGFGEEVPRVRTADNTDEPQNRRVDYIIGAVAAAPPFSGPYLAVPADWKSVK
jgi:outer membrane protein OmpA-like peptidoglycan-associated protein